jgi:hypothetical protein
MHKSDFIFAVVFFGSWSLVLGAFLTYLVFGIWLLGASLRCIFG